MPAASSRAPELVDVALDLALVELTVALDFENDLFVGGVELEVEDVAQRVSVDLDNAVAWLDADLRGE